MKKRQLGSTGMEVSEIGFGAWQLGNGKDWSEMSDREAVRLVHEALDQGCNFFDTAPTYGGGKSESILGQALSGKRDEVVISSKCGHQADKVTSFEPGDLIRSVEDTLKRLNTDYLDSLLLHNPPFDHLNGSSAQFDVLKQLKKEGKIRAYGASVDTGKELKEVITTSDSTVIEVMFNILYQEPLEQMTAAYDKGVGLIVKVPLDSGWLTGKYDADSTFTGVRSRWSKSDIEFRGALVDKVRGIIGPDASMIETALQYILSYRETATVIPGMRTSEQVRGNLSAADVPMPEEMKQALRQFWVEEIEGKDFPW